MSGGPNQLEFLSLLEQLDLRNTSSLLSSRATSERSLASGLRFHHAASPSPHGHHGLRGSGRSQYGGYAGHLAALQAGAASASQRNSQVLETDEAIPERNGESGQDTSQARRDQGHEPVRPESPALHHDTDDLRQQEQQQPAAAEASQQQVTSAAGSHLGTSVASVAGSVSSASSGASMSASRAAIMHESPLNISGGHYGSSSAVSAANSLTLSSKVASAHDLSPTSHAPQGPASLASATTGTNVSGTTHRRSMSMSGGGGSKRSPPSQPSSNVRHSLSAGEVSAPITQGSVVMDIAASSLASSSSPPRLVSSSVSSVHSQASAQWQAAHLARFGSLPSSSSMDERSSYISHC